LSPGPDRGRRGFTLKWIASRRTSCGLGWLESVAGRRRLADRVTRGARSNLAERLSLFGLRYLALLHPAFAELRLGDVPLRRKDAIDPYFVEGELR
jgi:hypothetical protein